MLPELPKSRAVPASRTPHAATVFDRPSLSQRLVATRRPCAHAESHSFARLVPTRLRKELGFEITCVRSGNSQKARSTSLPHEFPLPLRRSLCVFLSPEHRAVTGSRTPHAATASDRYVSLATADAVLARYLGQGRLARHGSLRSLEHGIFPRRGLRLSGLLRKPSIPPLTGENPLPKLRSLPDSEVQKQIVETKERAGLNGIARSLARVPVTRRQAPGSPRSRNVSSLRARRPARNAALAYASRLVTTRLRRSQHGPPSSSIVSCAPYFLRKYVAQSASRPVGSRLTTTSSLALGSPSNHEVKPEPEHYEVQSVVAPDEPTRTALGATARSP